MLTIKIKIIVDDNLQDATILVYLFIHNQLYMFRAMFSPIIRSTWLYLQLLILSTVTAVGCIMDEKHRISSMIPAGSSICGQYQKQ